MSLAGYATSRLILDRTRYQIVTCPKLLKSRKCFCIYINSILLLPGFFNSGLKIQIEKGKIRKVFVSGIHKTNSRNFNE